MFWQCGYNSELVSEWDLKFIGVLKEDCETSCMFLNFGVQGLSIYVNSEQTLNIIKDASRTKIPSEVSVNLI